MKIDVQSHVREQKNSDLPSESMRKSFEIWEEQYSVDNLTDLTVSQIESRRHRFSGQVQRLMIEHNPGKLIKNNPELAASSGKPPYTPQEWEEAQEMIRRKEEKTINRFERAKGIVEKERRESKLEQLTDLVGSATLESVTLNLFNFNH